jgi:hypothetical protein
MLVLSGITLKRIALGLSEKLDIYEEKLRR